MKYWPAKQPAEVVDYEFGFAGLLQDGETIASKLVTAIGVTVDSSAIVASAAGQVSASVRVWISGGAEGTVGRVTCRITTSSFPARVFEEIALVAVGVGPIDLAQAKAQLRIEDDSEDALVAAYLAAAVDHVETVTGKYLSPRPVRQVAAGFGGAVRLFRAPVREVVAIGYDPSAGDGSPGAALTLADYRLVEGDDGLVMPAVGASFPATLTGRGTVRIDYIAGYEPGEMPAAMGHAVKVLLSFFYAARDVDAPVPKTIDRLIAPYRPIGIA